MPTMPKPAPEDTGAHIAMWALVVADILAFAQEYILSAVSSYTALVNAMTPDERAAELASLKATVPPVVYDAIASRVRP